jgi:hypothetical protein
MAQQLLMRPAQMQLAGWAALWEVQLVRQDAAAWIRRLHHLVNCCACLRSKLRQLLLRQGLVPLQMLVQKLLLLLRQ